MALTWPLCALDRREPWKMAKLHIFIFGGAVGGALFLAKGISMAALFLTSPCMLDRDEQTAAECGKRKGAGGD